MSEAKKVWVRQLNTSKDTHFELSHEYEDFSCEEFRVLISDLEHIPTKSIQFSYESKIENVKKDKEESDQEQK